ncbi:lipase family alpha/beta hydrolase [Pseudomonas syringae group genomosp. 3]|nr:alpha/beta hydrolase [Pseudomonas syringae group genomosp. 3]RMU35608.1 PGAP1-like protein [Pseudomonas syringae pv. primulae]
MTDKKVPLTTEIGEDGREYTTASMEKFGCEDDVVYISPRQAIPIIFVPGIMGTPLLATGSNAKIMEKLDGKWSWFADDLEWMGIYSISGGFNRLDRIKRKQLLDPDNTKVPRNPGEANFSAINPKESALPINEMEKRGWGTVLLGANGYGDILNFLEKELKTLFIQGQSRTNLKGAFLAFQSEIDSIKGYEPLDLDSLKKASNWSYPIYACGYNWLRSNEESADDLARYIPHVLEDCRSRLKFQCTQVIIVTHSMGGLVARRCAQKNPKHILGVVHGVQPAIGAGTAYRRVRGGWESAVGRLSIGKDAGEVTPIFASPGPLQLLPNQLYGNKWLKARSNSTTGIVLMELPVSGNPYQEIYSDSLSWWRLIDPTLIDPNFKTPKGLEKAWDKYIKNLNLAEEFHACLGTYYFTPTYAHFGADQANPAWNGVEWILQSGRNIDGNFSPALSKDTTKDLKLISDLGANYITLKYHHSENKKTYPLFHGSIVKDSYTSYNYNATMSTQDDTGDGTVPTHSGEAPSEHIKFSAKLKGLEHSGSYNSKTARAITLHSIVSIAKEAANLC